jgi:MerR family mercuric resistance operon transcriptional regulator
VLNIRHRFLDLWESDKVCSYYGVKQVRITNMRPLTIGTLAKAAGVHLETVRYYERIGLMPKPSRTASNYRDYGPEHVERLCFIRRAREIDFSIGEIKELLVLAEPGRASCAEVQTLTAVHLAEVRAKITDLRMLEAVLAGALGRCLMEPAPACPVLDMLASRGHPEAAGHVADQGSVSV